MVRKVRPQPSSDGSTRNGHMIALLAFALGAALLAGGCGTGIYQNFASNVNCALYGNCDDDCDDCDDWCDGCGGDWYGFGFGFDGFAPGDWGGGWDGGYPPYGDDWGVPPDGYFF